MDILETIHKEVDKAIKDGTTMKEFNRVLEPKLKALGWWGSSEAGFLGTPWRLNTIFRTNTQQAYNAGRIKGQIANKKSRPYLMLLEKEDKSARKTHKSRNGSIAVVTSKFWKAPNSWLPLNGFNCRGRTRALTAFQAKKRGANITGGGNPDKGFGRSPLQPILLDSKGVRSSIFNLAKNLKEIFIK